jgi:chloramphenicol 3-O-phosphotransferase
VEASAPVFVITGQLSAGKSTVARALLDRFPFGFHIDVDGIREMVTSGLASPLEWTDETTRQFALAVEASATLAAVYARAGFAVAIEDGIEADAVEAALVAAGVSDRMAGIVLRPRLDVALARNRERTNKAFDTSILENVMRQIDTDLGATDYGERWTVIDNSNHSVDETVESIISLSR